MPTYVTKIRRPTGETEEQLLTVPQEAQLGDYLARVDGFVIDCSLYDSSSAPAPASTPTSTSTTATAHRAATRLRSRPSEVVQFSWHLFTLVHAGVPLARALDIIRNQLDQPHWQTVIGELIASLQKGNSFADSLKRFPKFFPSHFGHIVDVGEISGNLEVVLEQLARHGEQQLETRSRITGALIYPVILIVSCAAVVTFLMSFVLPRIAQMFENLGLTLPAVTALLVSVGEVLRTGLPWFLGGLFLAVGGVSYLRHTTEGRNWLGQAALRAPLFGPIYQKLVFSRYCQTLALLQASGVSLLVSLEVARAGIRNPVLAEFFQGVEKNLQEGVSMGDELARSPYIPPLVTSMISVGEETGQLSDMLQNVTRFYQRDIEHTVRYLPKIIEPAVIVIMTAVIGTIAASVFVPLATIAKGVG